MPIDCQSAQPLIPGYLDGELSDHQAAPLRQHLLDCPGCRASVQETKNLRAWFVDDAEVEVPQGFAARVTRRAFAGDTGITELQPAQPEPLAPVASATGETPVLKFVLHLTAAAAIVLFAVSLAMQRQGRPGGSELQAQPTLHEALERLDNLNEEPDSGEEPTGEDPRDDAATGEESQR